MCRSFGFPATFPSRPNLSLNALENSGYVAARDDGKNSPVYPLEGTSKQALEDDMPELVSMDTEQKEQKVNVSVASSSAVFRRANSLEITLEKGKSEGPMSQSAHGALGMYFQSLLGDSKDEDGDDDNSFAESFCLNGEHESYDSDDDDDSYDSEGEGYETDDDLDDDDDDDDEEEDDDKNQSNKLVVFFDNHKGASLEHKLRLNLSRTTSRWDSMPISGGDLSQNHKGKTWRKYRPEEEEEEEEDAGLLSFSSSSEGSYASRWDSMPISGTKRQDICLRLPRRSAILAGK